MSVTWPFWLDCFPGLLCTDALAFPYPATALLSLTDPTEHAGRGDSPAPIPVRADATSSRDGLPFSLGSGFSPVKVTLSTEECSHACRPSSHSALVPFSTASMHSLLLLEDFLAMSTDSGVLAEDGKGARSF